ncbi:epimerase [Pseudomonas sp. NPDC088368]|jgi:uncharacterized protein YbjT (DUF2867 family)|uniref:epimerase n=1 Tax=Pseudomonas sp. NPDC088368 TaxID=3364453 RepID=UPI00380CA8E3
MNVLMFGATGMVGQGVLRECLAAPDVDQVVSITRSPIGLSHYKLSEQIVDDFFDYHDCEAYLRGFDACFFCLGVSVMGLSESAYTRVTYDLTLAAAHTLSRLNPQMTFVYVSGAGTDSTEQGRSLWARIKGRTENALLRLPFKAVYLFRPGVIQPLNGVRSKTALYRSLYAVMAPLLTLMRRVWPNVVLTTETLGQAMLNSVRRGAEKPVLEARDINALAGQS